MLCQRFTALLCAFVLMSVVAFRPAPAVAAEEKKPVSNDVVAVFTLQGPVTESPPDEMAVLFGGDAGISLRELVKRMNKAADDQSVKAVVLLAEGGQVGAAQLEEVRQAIKKIRASGKEVYAHSGSIALGEYVLLSGANRVSVVPTGDLWITGLYAEQPYLRGLLDMLGVKPDFMTCGAYKSAAELFMRTGPSPEADAMYNWLFDGIYNGLVRQIASGRGVDESKVRGWIDNGPYSAAKAKDLGLIDAVEQRQDFEAMLREKFGAGITFDKKYGAEKKQQLDLSSPMAMFKIWGELLGGGKKPAKSDKPAVAIVYVEGPIIEGKTQANPLSGGGPTAASTPIRKALDEVARDEAVKAVVLRVDSPGGSAVASEIILDATRRVKANKPFVVSMGNVAGSGGYYVACGADTIFADENTITGSIGVVFGKITTNPMWKKVGITFTPYKRGANAGVLSTGEELSPEQRQQMQAWMNDIYETFKGHVTEIRGDRLTKPIEDLAGGRVYTGRQALELGLVDKIGTLHDAIEHVAKEANLGDEYEVRIVPKPKSLIEQIFADLGGSEDEQDKKYLQVADATPGGSIIDAALPHLQHLDPQRVRVVLRTLRQLQTLQSEGCVLMMPEVVIGN